jgi:diguanylate cyclase (GGDEF)-like protein
VEGPTPLDDAERWQRGWIRFRTRPTGASTRSLTVTVATLSMVTPLFLVATVIYQPHLRSAGALVAALILFVLVTAFSVHASMLGRQGRFDELSPTRNLLMVSLAVVEFGLFGAALGIHGGALLLMPCTAFLVAAWMGNGGMILATWVVLVATVGAVAGTQVPSAEAWWLTVVFTGTAALMAIATDRALRMSLHGVNRNQSLATLASFAGTLSHWPDDLLPIAAPLAEALDVDRYAVLARYYEVFHPVLSWPDADWPDADQLGDLANRAALSGTGAAANGLVAAASHAGTVDIVVVVPALSVLHVPVDPILLSTGAALLAAMCDRARLMADLVDLANTDHLTGAANRRRLFEVLDNDLTRARRSGRPLAIAILDLDNFKRYNDDNGHGAGDKLLRRFVDSVTARIRAQDLLARYGGEEFCIVLPETDADGARELVEAVRCWVESDVGGGGVTFSAGVAAWDGAESLDSLILRADTNLYRAKSDGRNRVVASVETEGPATLAG